MSDRDDFYVGYLPEAPPALARTVRRRVITAALLGCVAIVILALAQSGFAPATFEYGHPRTLEGWIVAMPYPTLIVPRPGADTVVSRYLLVAEGKHGADALARPHDGRWVAVNGTLIHRSNEVMLETVAIQPAPARVLAVPHRTIADLGVFDLEGEILDAKCDMGVMNPGSGKTHRACAARCLSGGIPPAFGVRDSTGAMMRLLLVDPNGRPIPAVAARFAGQPLRIRGRVIREDDLLFLRADPTTYQRITR
jgi:hypothetical protein